MPAKKDMFAFCKVRPIKDAASAPRKKAVAGPPDTSPLEPWADGDEMMEIPEEDAKLSWFDQEMEEACLNDGVSSCDGSTGREDDEDPLDASASDTSASDGLVSRREPLQAKRGFTTVQFQGPELELEDESL